MASNRPMFDDEDLPAWLKAAGISYGGQPEPLPPTPATDSQPGGDELPWAAEEFAGAAEEAPWLQGAAPAEPLAPASGEALPWLEDVAPAQTALPAAPAFDESLPWESTPAAADVPSGEQAPGELDWQQAAVSATEADSSETKTGVTGVTLEQDTRYRINHRKSIYWLVKAGSPGTISTDTQPDSCKISHQTRTKQP
jgi:hypothetical protein